MIKLENPTMKDVSLNLQKVFHNILTVVLLDVKSQFTYENVDPTIEKLQNVLESSISSKLQQEEFLSLHLKDFENTFVELNGNDESLINEMSVLESKLKETKAKYDIDIESKSKVIDDLKKELKEKEVILKNSIESYDHFIKSNTELSIAKENTEKLVQENKQLRHKLKCMECKFEALKKSCFGDQGKVAQNNEGESPVKVASVGKEELTTEKVITPKGIRAKEINLEQDFNILEDTLNLSTLNSQVELLTEQIDNLKSKKIQVEDDIDMKEGKIISLQSTIDKMKIIILQCKTKEHNLSLQLEYANLKNDKLQRTISNIKKEKDAIHKSAEKSGLKSTYMENQWDRIVTMSNKKSDKIQSLQNEKNTLLLKIKENSKQLTEKDVELDQLKEYLEETKQRYLKLYKGMDKMKNNCIELEKNRDLHLSEKKSLEKKLMESGCVEEDQLGWFLKQLKMSKEELKTELNKSFDGMDVLDIAQRVIKKQRSEIVSLKANMKWMKEALEVSGKERQDLQSQLSQRNEEFTKVQAKLFMLEETNKYLNNSLVTHQADSASLQNALKNAVVSYDGVCTMFEKQEKALEEERNSYNSEIMELENKLKRRSVTKGVSGFHPAKSGIQCNEELRHVLNNIKDQLSSTLSNMNSKLENVQSLSNASQIFNKTDDSGAELTEDTTLTNSTHTHIDENVVLNSTAGSNTQKLNQYLEMHNSSNHCSESTFFGMTSDKACTDQSKSLSYSSYPMLSSTVKGDSLNLKLLPDTSLSLKVNQYSLATSANVTSDSSIMVKRTVPSNENNAVLKLQEKLSHLQQMGTHLKTNNTELTEMMKTHSKKLKMLKNKASDNK